MTPFRSLTVLFSLLVLTISAAWAGDGAPTYIQAQFPRAEYKDVKVQMPTKIPLGQHPGIYLSRDEFVQLRDTLKSSPRGQKILADFVGLAKGAANLKIEFPDPKIPAQMGDRTDPPAVAHDRLSALAGKLGYAYQLTDDEAAAEKAREILVGYAQRYPHDYVEHKGRINPNDTAKVFAQRLSEAMWLLPLIQSYDCIYNSKCLTAADHKLIEADLFRTCCAFIIHRDAAAEVAQRTKANPEWRTAEPKPGQAMNWTNFYNAAYIQTGIATGDQDWIDIGAANTRFNILRGIGDDGMWGEGAIGYQQFALMALIASVEPLARHGIDLYSYHSCRLKNMWDSGFNYAYPDGTAPGINDSARVPIATGADYQSMVYDYAWLRYGDPQYAPIVNSAWRQIGQSQGIYFPALVYQPLPVQPHLPPPGIQTSVVFDKLGYAIFRGQDHNNPTYLLFKTSAPIGPHSHPDKLNLILFAEGDQLTGEPTFYRYEDPRCIDWTKTTIAHFTLAVDEKNQTDTAAKLLAYNDAGPVKALRGQCDSAYKGVLLDRTVVQMPGYIADIYRASSDANHSYDYPLCFPGKLDALADVSLEKINMAANLGQSRGYDSLKPGKTLEKTADTWKGEWKRDAAAKPGTDVKVTHLGAPAANIYLCRDVDGRDRAIVRRTGKEALFATIINPFQGDNAVASVEPLKVEGPVPAFGLRVKRTDGGQDLIIVRFDPQAGGKLAGPSTFDGGQTNALITVLRLDPAGKLLAPSGFLGGTTARAANTPITIDPAGIEWTR